MAEDRADRVRSEPGLANWLDDHLGDAIEAGPEAIDRRLTAFEDGDEVVMIDLGL